MLWKGADTLKTPSEQNWAVLKSFTPGEEERNRMRDNIKASIRAQTGHKEKDGRFAWKNLLYTAIFLIISGGLLVQLQQHDQYPERPGESQNVGDFNLSWDLDSVYSEKNANGFVFFEEGNPEQVGMAEFVNVGEKEKLLNTKAINTEKEMANFPYPTSLYIEHVKMMDVSLRYHFFVKVGKETMHFSFDYPKLEYAEIFQLISSLDFINLQPYQHDEQLYVTHGYGSFPYPVGLRPLELSGNTETYMWDKGIPQNANDYIENIRASGLWKQIKGAGSSYTFESTDRSEIVKISLQGKEITYEFSYPNKED
jgi:hypothetical protein